MICELCKCEWDETEHGAASVLYGLNVCECCHDNWACGDLSIEVVQNILKGAQFGEYVLRKRLSNLEAKITRLESRGIEDTKAEGLCPCGSTATATTEDGMDLCDTCFSECKKEGK